MSEANKQTTTAATVQTDKLPQVDMPEGSGLVTLAAAVIGSILWFRRKVSRDNLEVVKDQSEGSMLRLAMEREHEATKAAREAWAKREEDAKLIGKLSSDVEHLTHLNQSILNGMAGLQDEVKLLRSILIKLIQLPEVQRVLHANDSDSKALNSVLTTVLPQGEKDVLLPKV